MTEQVKLLQEWIAAYLAWSDTLPESDACYRTYAILADVEVRLARLGIDAVTFYPNP
jgi:hypothetical protein